MPLAILIALVTVTTLYILVAVVAVAAQPYDEFKGQEAGLAAILEKVVGASWPGTVLAAGAVISIFSVTLVTLYGQTRILFAMSRDGMSRVVPQGEPANPHPGAQHDHRRGRDRAAGRPDSDRLPRRNDEHRHAGRVPRGVDRRDGAAAYSSRAAARVQGAGYPVTPILAILGCIWIIKDLRPVTIYVFLIWVAVAMVWYAVYGFRQSHLGRHEHVGLIHD